MKIILYTLGKLYHRYKDNVCWEDVIAVSDSNPLALKNEYPVPAVALEDVIGMNYDYIAVFSDRFFDEIRFDLIGKYFIVKDKIISWRALLHNLKSVNDSSKVEIYQFIHSIVTKERIKKIIDLEMECLSQFVLSKDSLGNGVVEQLDGIRRKTEFSVALYDNIYSSIKEIRLNYDLAILDYTGEYTDDDIKKICKSSKKMLFFSCVTVDEIEDMDAFEVRLAQYGHVHRIVQKFGIVWLVDTRFEKNQKDISIYIVMHKSYGVPHFYPYKPLCVGGYEQSGCLSETDGENIAYLNSKINECTALYWMWKNSTSEYIGLNHYRRYFYNDSIQSPDNILEAEYASDILRNYDIILPRSDPWMCTMEEGISQSIDTNAFQQGLDVLKRCMKKVQPSYMQAFDLVMKRYNFYMCNMFVTHKALLDEYCSWLFSFLIDAAESIDVSKYDSYSKRVIGFFAERMLTVWLYDKKLKIKELPFYNPKC